MVTTKQRKRLGREELQRIIDLCRAVEERGLDPFLINVEDLIAVIREYFPEWKLPEDLVLDAESIQHLASVIKMQSEWVKHRSTSLYTDPFLLEEKIRRLSREQLGSIFLRSWHPTVEMEQISLHSLTQAIQYWNELMPLEERWQKTQFAEIETGTASRDELLEQELLADKMFSEELDALWKELLQRTERLEKIKYWDFIGASTFELTVHRAYITSFLVTYGYATMEIDRLEETIFLRSYKKPVSFDKKQVASIPITVNYDDWVKWKEGRLD